MVLGGLFRVAFAWILPMQPWAAVMGGGGGMVVDGGSSCPVAARSGVTWRARQPACNISSFWGLSPEPTHLQNHRHTNTTALLYLFVVPTALFDCGEHSSFLYPVRRAAPERRGLEASSDSACGGGAAAVLSQVARDRRRAGRATWAKSCFDNKHFQETPRRSPRLRRL